MSCGTAAEGGEKIGFGAWVTQIVGSSRAHFDIRIIHRKVRLEAPS